MKTNFTVIDTSKTKVITHNNAYFELSSNCLKWLADYKCTPKENDEEIEKEEDIYNIFVIDKAAITSVILYRITSSGNWAVEVEYAANKVVMVHYLKSEYSKAKETFNDIFTWKFGTKDSD